MTEENQTEGPAEGEEKETPPKPRKKKVTLTFIVDEDVNQNDFKNWVKSCPFSHEGGQTLAWEHIED